MNVCYRIRLSCGQPRKCSIPVESESEEEDDESPEHKGTVPLKWVSNNHF